MLGAGRTRRSFLLLLGHLCATSQLEHDGPCKIQSDETDADTHEFMHPL